MAPTADRQVKIISGYQPGALGRIVELHGIYYKKHWDFGLFFEAKAATEMAEFLNRFDEAKDGFWLAELDGQVVGGLSIDAGKPGQDGARLRWFIIDEGCQGLGVGRLLMRAAMDHCRAAGLPKIFLWTFVGLDAARKLYEDFGFKLVEEHPDDQWGEVVHEQRFVLEF